MRGILKAVAAGAMGLAMTLSAHAAEYEIGLVVPTLDAQFWNSYIAFTKRAAKEFDVELTVINADNQPDKLIRGIEDLVARDVDGIIFTPYWSTAAAGLTLAKQADIPVIITDSYPEFQPQDPMYPNYLAFVGPSDRESGRQMAEALFSAVKPDADGKKQIAVVNGTAGTSVAVDRRAGFQDALDKNPDVVVVGEVDGNFVRDTSQTVFESLWQGHPETQGVWAANGGTATGVMAAIHNAGKVPGKDLFVVAMDLNPENVDAVEKGELLFDIGGHWLQGAFALVMLYDHLKGFPVPESHKNMKLGLLPLTQDRVAQFRKDFPDSLPDYDIKSFSQVFNPNAKDVDFAVKYKDAE